MSNWQPIETAKPKPWDEAIGGHATNRWVQQIFWDKERNSWCGLDGSKIDPTHWMPLPSPPEVKP